VGYLRPEKEELARSGFPGFNPIRLDAIVLGFNFVISLATGVLFGLLPAFRAPRPDLSQSLNNGASGWVQGFGRMRRLSPRTLLVTGEIAGSPWSGRTPMPSALEHRPSVRPQCHESHTRSLPVVHLCQVPRSLSFARNLARGGHFRESATTHPNGTGSWQRHRTFPVAVTPAPRFPPDPSGTFHRKPPGIRGGLQRRTAAH
jgi:hypothetical protein